MYCPCQKPVEHVGRTLIFTRGVGKDLPISLRGKDVFFENTLRTETCDFIVEENQIRGIASVSVPSVAYQRKQEPISYILLTLYSRDDCPSLPWLFSWAPWFHRHPSYQDLRDLAKRDVSCHDSNSRGSIWVALQKHNERRQSEGSDCERLGRRCIPLVLFSRDFGDKSLAEMLTTPRFIDVIPPVILFQNFSHRLGAVPGNPWPLEVCRRFSS